MQNWRNDQGQIQARDNLSKQIIVQGTVVVFRYNGVPTSRLTWIAYFEYRICALHTHRYFLESP